MKRYRKYLFLGILILFLGMGSTIAYQFYKTMTYGEHFKLVDLHLDEVDNGLYQGTSSWGLVQVKLEVQIENHSITTITLLEHTNGKGGDAELIIPMMVSSNTNDVDVISGATISSKAIQNAVQDAIQ